MKTHTTTTGANKTDAGNGSYGICRVIDASRSPSPDPERSQNKMKFYTKVISATIILILPLSYAGDFVDLGKADKVPNWAIGPLLVLPVERVQDRKLVAERKEAKRLGTIQQNYAEIDGERLTFEAIHLSEVPNDGYSCEITTKPKNDHYLKIHLSQSLYDQTFYYVYIQKFKIGIEKALEANQYAVWDIKSRR